MSMLRLPAFISVLLLTACAGTPPTPVTPSSAGTCNAEAAQAWIGKPASEANIEAAFKASGARTVRSLKPGQAMTMDYREDRVNILQDASGNIEKISCG